MTRVIRASSRQVVIPSVRNTALWCGYLPVAKTTGGSTPEAGGVREETTRRARRIYAKRAGLARPVTSSNKTKINVSGIPAGNAARSIPATRRNPRYSCATPVPSSSMRQRNNHEPALSCLGHGGREVRLVFLLFYARTVHDARGLR